MEIYKKSWSPLPVFDVMKDLGKISDIEMFRTFNMGIGMIFIISQEDVSAVSSALKNISPIFKIGEIVSGKGEVKIR